MARPWPTDEVEAILEEKGARKTHATKLPAFVTRGEPIRYVPQSGTREMEIHWSTEVEIRGRWQNLLELVHENIAEFRRRQHR